MSETKSSVNPIKVISKNIGTGGQLAGSQADGDRGPWNIAALVLEVLILYELDCV